MQDELSQNRSVTLSPVLVLIFVMFVSGVGIALSLVLAEGDSTQQQPAIIEQPSTRSLINQPAPDFILNNLDGTPFRLSDLRGRIVFLNFWATWCTPCRREMPAFERFVVEQGDTGPLVIAVNGGEAAEGIRAFLEEVDATNVTVLLDPGASIQDMYGVVAMPTTFILDENGVLRAVKYGEMTDNDFNNYITLLQETMTSQQVLPGT